MAYYDGPSWQGQGSTRQASWEQPSTPRSAGGSVLPREEVNAFLGQFEEVERAIDNLSKSGKMFPVMAGRREPGPMHGMGRGGFGEFQDPRMGGQRHHSMEFDPMRSHSSPNNLQNFYANQRFQSRHGENEQMQQAKRRMAAQRERELRNYHQEQQYNRSVMAEISTQGKSDRSSSPNMSEEDRREFMTRQHRGMYANDNFYESTKFNEDGQTPRPLHQQVPPSGGRGPSPMTFNNYGQDLTSTQSVAASGVTSDDATKGTSPKPNGPRSRSNSNSSPASAHNPQNYSLFETTANAQQSSRTSNSSPGGSPPRPTKGGGAPAPIGTRPVNQALNKRATPPANSPLSFGFASTESSGQGERTGSSASNPPASSKETTGGSGSGVNWGSGSGVWGQSKLGGVQTSVWS